MEVQPWVLITMTSGLLTIGIAVGSIGARFVTRPEFQKALDKIHLRIDQVFVKIDEVKDIALTNN